MNPDTYILTETAFKAALEAYRIGCFCGLFGGSLLTGTVAFFAWRYRR